MNFLFFQILRIENGVVARDAEDDREIGPRKDIGRRVPVDGSFVDDK